MWELGVVTAATVIGSALVPDTWALIARVVSVVFAVLAAGVVLLGVVFLCLLPLAMDRQRKEARDALAEATDRSLMLRIARDARVTRPESWPRVALREWMP